MNEVRRFSGKSRLAFAAALSLLVLAIAPGFVPGAAAVEPQDFKCNDLPGTIVGTPESDTLTGTNARDVIIGRGGGDLIRGLGGNDVLCGHGGRDEVLGGDGRDEVSGGLGTDELSGGAGDDTVKGRFGSDTFSGGGGDDLLRGGDGDDLFSGGRGEDLIRGWGGADQMNGGPQNDILRGMSGIDTANGGTGNDLCTAETEISCDESFNDPPAVTTSVGSTSYTEGDPATTIDGSLTVTDADDTNLEGGQVRISNNFQSGDDLVFINQNGIGGVYNTGTGVLTLTGTASVADYQTALRSIQFQTTNTNPSSSKTVEFKVNDGDADSNAATKSLSISPSNDAPVVNTSGGSTSYTEGDPATTIDGSLTVTDADDTNLEGGQVRISNNFQSGDDLVFINQNGISGVYNTGTGVLTLTGTASVADYQTALRSIQFQTTNDNPSSSKTVEFKVNDGDVDSNAATKSLSITDV
jgi:hypothetical protein